MELHWPETVERALELLSADGEARALSGGATLVAMMNAGLVAPQRLVFLRKIPQLKGIRRNGDGTVSIGAMTTHETIEAWTDFDAGQAVVRMAAGRIAHPPIRAVGTIGGAIAHADPSSDYPAALVAADAEIVCIGRGGERRVPAHAFFRDYFESALEPGEIVGAVLLPKSAPGTVAVYDKLARVEGDYATVSVAAVIASAGGVCRRARLAAGSCGPRPVRSDEADALLVGSDLGEAIAAKAAALLGEAADPVDDVRGSAAYRRRVMMGMTRRAIQVARAGGAA